MSRCCSVCGIWESVPHSWRGGESPKLHRWQAESWPGDPVSVSLLALLEASMEGDLAALTTVLEWCDATVDALYPRPAAGFPAADE